MKMFAIGVFVGMFLFALSLEPSCVVTGYHYNAQHELFIDYEMAGNRYEGVYIEDCPESVQNVAADVNKL